jgi:predicted nucleotidyltransferase
MRGRSPEAAVLNPDFRDILSAFIDQGVEFLVVGGYAMAAHRLPRATKDLDLWIRPAADNAARVLRALDAFGAPRHGLTAADLEAAGTIYQVGVPPNRVDVITTVEGIDFAGAWEDRLEVEIDGIRIPVIGRRDLIANKRTVRRPQDLVDADLLESLD